MAKKITTPVTKYVFGSIDAVSITGEETNALGSRNFFRPREKHHDSSPRVGTLRRGYHAGSSNTHRAGRF